MRYASALVGLTLTIVACSPSRSDANLDRATRTDAIRSTAVTATTPHWLPRVWAFPGSDVPGFCIALVDDSTGQFEGGFSWLSPFSWQYRSRGDTLHLGFLRRTPPDGLSGSNEATGDTFTIVERTAWSLDVALDSLAPGFEFEGYSMIPLDRLRDYELTYLRPLCPSLRAAVVAPY